MRLTLISALLAGLAPQAVAGGGFVLVDAGRGPVEVTLPTAFDPAVEAPLLLVLHGYNGSADNIETFLGLGPVADAMGYLYVRPEGTTDLLGAKFWNATPACCDAFGSGVDDSGYLRDLIEEIKRILPVDPSAVHVMGWSSGGYMAHRMACDHAEVIASIASLAGPTYDDPMSCVPADQVHVLQIHGTLDMSIDYNGGMSQGAPYPGAIDTVEQWATLHGCSLFPDTSAPPIDVDDLVPGRETVISLYDQGCAVGGSAELWSMVDSGHYPQLTATARVRLFDWFAAHRKPAPGSSYCTSTVHSGGRAARITTFGTESVAAEDLTLFAYAALPSTPGLFVAGTVQGQAPFGDGFLCAGPPIVRLPPSVPTSVGGDALLPLDFSAPYAQLLLDGATLNFQFWFRDTPAGGAGFNLTDARSVTLGP